ncbi:MAG: rod shape-determining protein MreC [Candidatus Saganbacteria bacterium]|nr:rod shape-determining protein MreC [Candidatus Saganbacteria bacterium]
MQSRIIIIVFLVLALTLNFAGIGKSRVVSVIKSTTLAALYPLQWVSNSSVSGISGLFSYLHFAYNNSLLNEELRRENEILKMELASLDALRSENRVFRNSRDRQRSRVPGNFKNVLLSHVIGRSQDPWNSFFVIDCGSAEGVLENSSVIAADGLVGNVVAVTPYTSRVRLLLDIKSAVTVKTVKSRIEALASGNLGGLLDLKYVSSGSKPLIGEALVVSSSSRLLPGIPVGYITRIGGSELDLFKTIDVQPAVDFQTLDVVYVVMQ